jgi:uncharacterized protein YabE (DUF348 family)
VTVSGDTRSTVASEQDGEPYKNSEKARHRATDATSFWDSEFFESRPPTGRSAPEHSGVGVLDPVTMQEVLAVLGPDAEDLLATSELEMGELIRRLNSQTMTLPPIDAELEAEIEAALAGHSTDQEPPAASGTASGTQWRKRFLRAGIAAVLLSAASGGVAAAQMDHTVTVDVDGQAQTVHTFSDTVGGVLASEGITVGPHDALSPSPSAPVTDGGRVVLDRGRELDVIIDGVRHTRWTRAGTLGEALRELNIDTGHAQVSKPAQEHLPLHASTVNIQTQKTLTLIDGAHEPRQVTTHAVTVGDLLQSLGSPLGSHDSVKPGTDTTLTDGAQIMVSRTGVTVTNSHHKIKPAVHKKHDDSMLEGHQKVADPGKAGEKVVTYRITKTNGKETKREELKSKVTQKPKPKVVEVGTKEPAHHTDSDSGSDSGSGSAANEGIWDKIAGCESGHDWHINTGNGYYGGLQFDHSTWIANGGGAYAPNANQATKAQQIKIANKVKSSRGLSPWQCAREMGMT